MIKLIESMDIWQKKDGAQTFSMHRLLDFNTPCQKL